MKKQDKKEKGMHNSFLYKILIPFILIIILIYFVTSDYGLEIIFGENISTIYPGRRKWTGSPPGSGWLLFFTCFLFLYPGYWFSQWSDRCPSCNIWSANEVLEEKLIDYDDFTSNYSETTKENNVSTTKHYKRTTETTTYNVFHKCKFCDHLWNTKKTERSESKERI